MPYLAVNDFKYGLDRRRARIAGVPGTLWDIQNAHLTRGGDIERAKKLVSTYTLPAGTFGMAQLLGQLYAFGSADLSASMPSGVLYQRLTSPVVAEVLATGSVTILRGTESAGVNKISQITVNGVNLISAAVDWITSRTQTATNLAAAINTLTGTHGYTAVGAGAVVTITAAADTGAMPNTYVVAGTVAGDVTVAYAAMGAAPVTEVLATGTVTITGGSASPGVNKISQITVNSVNLMTTAVDWITSNTVTATNLATEINANTGTSGYTAVAVNAVVTIAAVAGTGAMPNAYVVAGTLAGNVTATYAAMANGITTVATVAGVTAIAAGVMTRIWDVKLFNSKFYVVAEYDTGGIHHFYDGTRVTEWDDLADENASVTTLADFLALKLNANSAVTVVASGSVLTLTAKVPGTSFTPSVNNSVIMTLAQTVANVAAVAEVRATGTIEITGGTASPGINKVSQVTVDGVSLLTAAINWVGSHSATAAAVAVGINNNTATHGFQAAAVGAVITITAATGLGATVNTDVVTGTMAGNVTATYANLSGGVTTVAAVAQVYTVTMIYVYVSTAKYAVTVNGTAYASTGRASGMGTSVFVSKSRVWSTANTLWRFCKLNDATDWTDADAAIGAGYINISNQSEGADRLQCATEYNGYAAIFSRKQIRLYTLSGDASAISFYQSLDNTGIVAPRTLVAYGNNDVFYAGDTGIRSLRPRDVLNAAYVSDIGTAIDTFVSDYNATLTADQIYRGCAAIEPVDGRYWLAVGTRIYVLSYFPTSQVTAWSYYALDVEVSDLLRIANRIYARAGNTIYLYGGTTGAVYPSANEQIVVIETPFLSAETPATIKAIDGFDMAASNIWSVLLRVDPNDSTKTINVGKPNNITFGMSGVGVPGRTSHVAVSLTCSNAGVATISGLGIHFTPESSGQPQQRQQAQQQQQASQ